MTTFLAILFSLILIGIGVIIFLIYQAKKSAKRHLEMLINYGLPNLTSKLAKKDDLTKSE